MKKLLLGLMAFVFMFTSVEYNFQTGAGKIGVNEAQAGRGHAKRLERRKERHIRRANAAHALGLTRIEKYQNHRAANLHKRANRSVAKMNKKRAQSKAYKAKALSPSTAVVE